MRRVAAPPPDMEVKVEPRRSRVSGREHRVSFALTAESYEHLGDLSERCGLSIPQLFRRAVQVYGLLWEHVEGGSLVIVRSGDGKKEQRLPMERL